MKKLSRNELKGIKGGNQGQGNASCCSVTCSNGITKDRECGSGVMCTTNSPKICCGGSDCIDVCNVQ